MFCPQTGASALSLATQEGKVEVVRILMEAKALVNIQKKVYTSPSLPHTCISSSHDREEQLLLIHGICVTSQSYC